MPIGIFCQATKKKIKKFRLFIKSFRKLQPMLRTIGGKYFRQDKTAADAGFSSPLKLPTTGKLEQIEDKINRKFAKFTLTLRPPRARMLGLLVVRGIRRKHPTGAQVTV
jgi:hypothetical protein